jgi:hypothetical protein
MSHEERSIYNLETGLFTSVIIAVHDDLLDANTPSGHKTLIGRYDHLSQRVDLATGEVVDYQPPQPSSDDEWNAETKRWQLIAAAADRANRHISASEHIGLLEASQHRALREHALGYPGAVDRLKEIDQEIAALRKDLSDAPSQLPA